MEGWKRSRVDNYNSEEGRTRSRYKKPPNVGGWQQTVPSWEKKFCASVCSIPWWKVMEMKSTIHIYDNILKWDDSAGNEAFNNAKARFFANMRGFQCNLPIPDPDMYIDEINWDSKNDPELEFDLENDSQVPTDGERESVVIFGNSFVSNQGFSGTGWGDTEQDNVKNAVNSSAGNNDKSWGGFGNYGDEEAVKYNNECGYGWNNSKPWGWNGNYNDSYGQNSQGTGGYTQQYRGSSYRGGQGQNRKGGNGRRRGNYVSEKQVYGIKS